MELRVPRFLNLVHHWLFSVYEIDEKKRVRVQRQLVGVLTTMEDEETDRPRWAPAWWDGDVDATASNMAAMKALQRR